MFISQFKTIWKNNKLIPCTIVNAGLQLIPHCTFVFCSWDNTLFCVNKINNFLFHTYIHSYRWVCMKKSFGTNVPRFIELYSKIDNSLPSYYNSNFILLFNFYFYKYFIICHILWIISSTFGGFSQFNGNIWHIF